MRQVPDAPWGLGRAPFPDIPLTSQPREQTPSLGPQGRLLPMFVLFIKERQYVRGRLHTRTG